MEHTAETGTAVKVLVTGSREWKDRALIRAALKAVGATIVIHGDHCKFSSATGEPIAGADWHAKEAAKELGIEQKPYPADWERYGKKAGPIRNSQMVAENPDIAVCLAFPLPDSRGTWDCVGKADKAGIKVRVMGDSGIRRMDTPDNRAFWLSVMQVADYWEETKPTWAS